MPVITVNGPALSLEKKRELVKDLTEVASRVIGVPEEVSAEKPKRGGCRRKKS